MTRKEIINWAIQKYKFNSYLEIGVGRGDVFLNIPKGVYKVGVDIDESSPATHHMTSKEYFMHNAQKFDLIFIDGDHREDTAFNDILSATEVLSHNGIIVVHDTLPKNEREASPEPVSGAWCGEVWKAVIQAMHWNLIDEGWHFVTIDCDRGVTLIRRGQMNIYISHVKLNYGNFQLHKNRLLNVVSESEALEVI